MTRLSKIGLVVTSALVIGTLFCAALPPHSARAFARRYLSSPSNILDSPLLASRSRNLPAITFWAWERPEDLRFLKTNQAAVAFLAKTIYIRTQHPASGASAAASFTIRPRLQPLRIATGSPLIAVVRIEAPPAAHLGAASPRRADFGASISNSAALRDSLAFEIAQPQSIPGVRAIQIDFDATTSEHPFYAALLQDVRRKLPASMPLSITALASWCIGDPWLAKLPPGTIDEAVPMLFRMGPDSTNVAKFLRSGEDFPVAACRTSLGLSTDEPLSQILLSGRLAGLSTPLRVKRVYVFAPRAWTQPAAQEIFEELQP